MDLRKLVYFATVAEFGSFTQAAVRLHVAQPALSRQIKLLEQELGLELFMRMGRTIRLTDAGDVLLEHAHELIRGFERTKDEMESRLGRPKGRVLFGIPPSLGPVVLPQLIDRIRLQFPQISLKVREGTSVVLEEWLSAARIDLALISHRPTSRGMTGETLVQEQVGLIGRPKIVRSVEGRRLTAFDAPLMLTLQVQGLIAEMRREIDFAMPPTLEIDAIQVIKELVLRGSGLALLPVAFFMPEIERGDLAVAPLKGARLIRQITLVFSSVRRMSRAVEEVARFTRGEVQALKRAGAFAIPGDARGALSAGPASAATSAHSATQRQRSQRR